MATESGGDETGDETADKTAATAGDERDGGDRWVNVYGRMGLADTYKIHGPTSEPIRQVDKDSAVWQWIYTTKTDLHN